MHPRLLPYYQNPVKRVVTTRYSPRSTFFKADFGFLAEPQIAGSGYRPFIFKAHSTSSFSFCPPDITFATSRASTMSNVPASDGDSEAGSGGGRSAAATTVTAPEIDLGDSPSQQVVSSSGSIVSDTTSVEGGLYRVIGGRIYNAQTDLYPFPADEEEHSRLDMQNFAICLTMDSLFPFQSEVRHLLREGQATPPQILDIGTGSGRWAVDMAKQFPYAEVIGMDLAPPALLNRDEVPKNCRFEVDDANLSMEHYANTFDLVHARMMEYGLNDVESFFYEVARTLKPGGMLIKGYAPAQLLDEHKQPFTFCEPGDEGFSWVQRMFGLAHLAGWNRGAAASRWKHFFNEILEANPNYSEVRLENMYIPLGSWPEGLNEREAFAANLMRETLARVFVLLQPLFLADGHPDEDVTWWIDDAVQELKDMSPRSYMHFVFVGATRSNGKWEERGMESVLTAFESRIVVRGLVFESRS